MRENITAFFMLYVKPVAAVSRILDHGRLWFAIAAAIGVSILLHMAGSPILDSASKMIGPQVKQAARGAQPEPAKAEPSKAAPADGADDDRFPITPQRIVADVRTVMPADGIVALVNDTRDSLARIAQAKESR